MSSFYAGWSTAKAYLRPWNLCMRVAVRFREVFWAATNTDSAALNVLKYTFLPPYSCRKMCWLSKSSCRKVCTLRESSCKKVWLLLESSCRKVWLLHESSCKKVYFCSQKRSYYWQYALITQDTPRNKLLKFPTPYKWTIFKCHFLKNRDFMRSLTIT